jgi:hypothetical protein
VPENLKWKVQRNSISIGGLQENAPVAQLDRASGFEPEGQKSRASRHLTKPEVIESFFAPVAQLDRALVFGTKGWRFKSSQVRHHFGYLP